MPEYYLIAKHSIGFHETEVLVELEASTLEAARADADRRLRGNPDAWHTESRPNPNDPAFPIHIKFFLDPHGRNTLLHPHARLFQSALIVQVVDERPVLAFQEELLAWARTEDKRIRRQFDADPEYCEYRRLKKKFETPQKTGPQVTETATEEEG